ncbi:MAG: creatininase family protein [Methanomassiliicoccaceae archaeon]|jgi:creatinine amidohydrolase|nr:creatininase family protein [Methanomassiliicoccaceae archaeon]
MRIDRITTDGFEKAVSKRPLLILPIGATEAHGIHLPLGTDTFQAEHVADAISKRMRNVLVAPTLPYGNHSSLKNVPGTVNITFDTLRSVICDILDSFIDHGISRILIISGHAGTSHMAAVTEACREIVSESKVKIMFVSDFDIAASCGEFRYDGDGHGGMIETSRMLAIDPGAVGKDRPKGKFVHANGMVLRDASSCIPDGIIGDTKGASPELGEKMNNHIVDTLIGMIERDLK